MWVYSPVGGEMGHYSPVDGQINRMLVLEHHDVKRGVDKLLEIIHRIV